MLFKLLKYDFRAMWKQFSLIWGAALALALVHRLTHTLHFIVTLGTRIANFTNLALAIVFVAMFVISVMFIIQRFSKGLLGGEGYLMHTLPVRPWQLVLSKLICAIVTGLGSCVVAFLSAILMYPEDFQRFFQSVNWLKLFRRLLQNLGTLVLAAEFCMVILSFLILFISTIYLAISIGHLFSHHRRLISLVSFIGLYILIANIYSWVLSYKVIQALVDAATVNAYGSMLTDIAIMLLPAAAFLAVVCWILENKLNLE